MDARYRGFEFPDLRMFQMMNLIRPLGHVSAMPDDVAVDRFDW